MNNQQELQTTDFQENGISQNNIDDVSDDIIIEENQKYTSELPLGDVLSISETYPSITAKEDSTFIALAGPSGCGKTTLVTAIYQIFQKGTVENYYFAGSETLLGFEQRAYLTRLRSGQVIPDTPKTRRGADHMLHIKIWDSCAGKILNLLISDFSGEDYSNIKANPVYAKSDFEVIKGAKCFVIILDGDLISKKDQRQSTLKDAVELLRTFIDADILRSDVSIIVAISKYDIVTKRYASDPSLSHYEEYIKKQFNAIAEQRNLEMLYINVSAVPDDSIEYNNESSLYDMLKNWVDSSINRRKYLYHEPNVMKSQFNRFLKKRRMVL